MRTGVLQQSSWNLAHRVLIMVGAALVAFTGFALLIEAGFYVPNHRTRFTVEQKGTYPAEFITKDSIYGYQILPNRTVRANATCRHVFAYDVGYSSDACGRRRTPVDPNPPRAHFVLFFADSFIFGTGVNDDETLPFYVGRQARDYMPYNYGCPGYGPQQMLLRFQTNTLRNEVAEASGIAVYLYIERHVNRVAGTLRTGMWDRNGPCYDLVDGRLQHFGTFRQARPVRTWLFSLLQYSQTLEYFGVDIPPRASDHHVELTARIIEESARLFREQFAGGAFYVLIYPGTSDTASHELMVSLSAKGVKMLYHPSLFKGVSWPTCLPDGHPTPRCHEFLAERLAQDLEIRSDP